MPVLLIVVIAVVVIGGGVAIIAPAVTPDPEPVTPPPPVEIQAPAEPGIEPEMIQEQGLPVIDLDDAQLEQEFPVDSAGSDDENPYLQFADETWDEEAPVEETPQEDVDDDAGWDTWEDEAPIDSARSGGAVGGLDRF